MMKKGDLIHIPQDVYLLGEKLKEWRKTEKPIVALFWKKDLKEPQWSSIYYKNMIWNVKNKDIYPIQETKRC